MAAGTENGRMREALSIGDEGSIMMCVRGEVATGGGGRARARQ